MENLFSAEEAKKLQNSVQTDKAQRILSKIIKCIKDRANDGENSCTVEESFLIAVKNKLLELGYKVDWNSDQRDGSYWSISW